MIQSSDLVYNRVKLTFLTFSGRDPKATTQKELRSKYTLELYNYVDRRSPLPCDTRVQNWDISFFISTPTPPPPLPLRNWQIFAQWGFGFLLQKSLQTFNRPANLQNMQIKDFAKKPGKTWRLGHQT